MSVEKATPLYALKEWEFMKNVKKDLLDKIKYFYGFQTYAPEEESRKPSGIFVTTDDEVYAIGYNGRDNLLALGEEDFTVSKNFTEPKNINELNGKKIKKVTVGERYGVALTEDGLLYYWGMEMKLLQNEEKDSKYVRLPYLVGPNIKVAKMSCAGHSITFLTEEGHIYIWGCLNLYYSTFYEFTKIVVPKDVNIEAISSGWYHYVMLDSKGRAWTYGIGSVGQLGFKPTSSYIEISPYEVELPKKCIKVECGANSTLFLLENGDVYACGDNGRLNNLCVGKKGNIIHPLRVLLNDPIKDIIATYAWSSQWASRYTAVSNKGEYFKWGEDNESKVPKPATDVDSLAEIYINFKTPQTLGDVIQTTQNAQRPKPVLPPPAVKNTPASSAPKKPSSGQTITPQVSVKPKQVEQNAAKDVPKPAVQTEDPGKTTKPANVKPNGNQTKPNSSTPKPGTSKPMSSQSSVNSEGFYARPNLSSDKSGHKTLTPVSSLGDQNQTDQTKPVQTEQIMSIWTELKDYEKKFGKTVTRFTVFSGYNSSNGKEGLGSFVITSDDNVYSFGLNTDERLLALDDGEDSIKFPTKVESLSGKKIKKIVVGSHQGVALTSNGSVFSWDRNSIPTLLGMMESAKDIACGSEFFVVLTNDSNIYQSGELSFEYEKESNKKIQVLDGLEVRSIECGEWHCAFVSTNEDAYTFGHGVYNQLGYEQDENSSYKPKKVPLPHPCIKVACGVTSTVFLLKNGDVYACGENASADKVGVGHDETVLNPEKIPFAEKIVDLVAVITSTTDAARVTSFAAKSEHGKIYRWGGKIGVPTVVPNVSTILEAYKGQAIPQSMSLINWPPQVGEGQKVENPKPEPTKGPEVPESAVPGKGKEPFEKEDSRTLIQIEKKPPKVQNMNKEPATYIPPKNSQETVPSEPSIDKPGNQTQVGEATANDSKSTTDTTMSDEKQPNILTTETSKDILLGNPLYSDLKIKLANGTVPVHKVLLYTKSPFFRRALSKNERIKELDLTSYNPKSVLALLKLIYGVPIGEKASIDEAADFQEFAEKDGSSAVLEMSKLLLYSSTLYDIISGHLDSKPSEFKARVLKAILPPKQFP